jgi:hypothetical protein
MLKFNIFVLLFFSAFLMAQDGFINPNDSKNYPTNNVLSSTQQNQDYQNLDSHNKEVRVSATGMGVAPQFAHSPAQSFALAKRAALVDAYRLLAERVGGVRIEGRDTIKNMQVVRSEVRASVTNSIRNAEIVETKFQDGMCEVQLEVVIRYDDLVR